MTESFLINPAEVAWFWQRSGLGFKARLRVPCFLSVTPSAETGHTGMMFKPAREEPIQPLAVCVSLCLLLLLPSCSRPPGPGAALQAKTEVIGVDGDAVGAAILEETQTGVRISLEVDGLQPGQYRYAFFDTAVCDPPDFQSAGEPYPAGAEIGMLHNMSPALPPSIGRFTVGADGTGRSEEVAPVVTRGEGGNSLLDGNGSALLVLELRAGGERRACGVIRP